GPSGSDSTLPTFTWNNVTGANHYDIWIQDAKTRQMLRDQNVTGTSWVPTGALTLGETYQWWVRAVDNVNSPRPWRTMLSFTAYARATPVLIGPSGSSSIGLPTFTWNAITGADHYEIWINDITSKRSPALQDKNVTGTSWIPAASLKQGDTYQWWVRA